MAARAALLVALLAADLRPPVNLPARDALEALVQPAWKALPASSEPPFWSLRLTPALPDTWPSPTGLVVFAFAGGMQPGLMDGERVAKPFARVVLAPGAAPRVEVLAKKLEAVGTQGVRPVGGKELETMKSGPEAQAELAAQPGQPSEKVRAYYCQWASFNGVIARALPEGQRAFFGALGCPL